MLVTFMFVKAIRLSLFQGSPTGRELESRAVGIANHPAWIPVHTGMTGQHLPSN